MHGFRATVPLASRIIFITGDIANEETVATLRETGASVRRETVSRSAIYRCGFENIWEGRVNNSKEDQRIRLLVVDDEQSIRKLCFDCSLRRWASSAWKLKAGNQRLRFSKNNRCT